MMSIFSDMIEKIMEVFMDDFTIYGKTFDDYLENLDTVLQRCEEKALSPELGKMPLYGLGRNSARTQSV
jgi:hypothetical protein